MNQTTGWLPTLDEEILQMEFNFCQSFNCQHCLLEVKRRICAVKVFAPYSLLGNVLLHAAQDLHYEMWEGFLILQGKKKNKKKKLILEY